MELSEKEIEDFIYNDLDEGGFSLQDNGLQLSWFEERRKIKWYRQLNIDPYGICDIVGFYRSNGLIICELIELKKTKIDCNHFEQIMRYRTGMNVYLKNTLRLKSSFIINLTLIGVGYDGLYIQNSLPISVFDMSYGLGGVYFSGTDGYTKWCIPSGKDKSFRYGKKI